MENAVRFREKLAKGPVCIGTCVTFSDPTVTEALCNTVDFVWIDTEHNPLPLDKVQGHILATKGTDTAPLVRVPWNDPVLIKPVLDIGAAGVIVPLVRTAEEVRRAVAACKYPPEGVRGYGPRRPSNYGRNGGPEYIRAANAAILPIVQIEHVDAVNQIEEILAVPGLATVVIGPNDLAGSLGHMGEPQHPEVGRAIDTVLAAGKKAGVPIGLAGGGEPEIFIDWANKGARWLLVGADFWLLLRAMTQLSSRIQEHVSGSGRDHGASRR